MDLKQFEILENKIVQMLELIKELKQENDGLRSKNQELSNQITEKGDLVKQLEKQIDSEAQNRKTTQFYEEREAQIRGRIQTMLEKLEALDLPVE